jgi:hypothetical protein
MATGIERVVGGFSWQVAPDLRIGAIYREPTRIDVALFSDSERQVASGVWSPDHPFDQNHGLFETLERHWGEHAIEVLDTLNAEFAKLSADGPASAP